MKRARRGDERGFIITLELVLIFTILGIGLLVGLVAIRNALFVWWQKKQAQTVWVFDSTTAGLGGPFILGPVRDFNEHETPRLFYIDRGVTWGPNPAPNNVFNFRAFIGVRDDRFTSRHRIFYYNANCTGQACIAGAGREDQDNNAVGTPEVGEAGGIGYLYALQQGPSYGIGADLNQTFGVANYRFPGTLYRQNETAMCVDANIQSAWESQKVVPGEPCEPASFATIEAFNCASGTRLNCNQGSNFGYCDPPDEEDTIGNPCCDPFDNSGDEFTDQNGDSCGQNASLLCEIIQDPNNVNDVICGCGPGYYNTAPQGQSANCCPIGTVGVPGGQCKQSLAGGLYQADPVTRFNGINFQPPFRVNLPPSNSNFVLTDPPAIEGGPGGLNPVPYDPTPPP